MQCAKQPVGSQTCGFYVCEYLRECKQYSSSWRVLKNGLNWWRDVQSTQHSFKQTKADICKFVLDKCVLEGGTFFNENSPLAILPEYERLRKWPTMMRPQDYFLAHV